MNGKLVSIILTSALFVTAGAVRAEGCVTGAAAGGVAGHVAGKHGKAGAIGGCAIGHHEASKKEKTQHADAGNGASAPASK